MTEVILAGKAGKLSDYKLTAASAPDEGWDFRTLESEPIRVQLDLCRSAIGGVAQMIQKLLARVCQLVLDAG